MDVLEEGEISNESTDESENNLPHKSVAEIVTENNGQSGTMVVDTHLVENPARSPIAADAAAANSTHAVVNKPIKMAPAKVIFADDDSDSDEKSTQRNGGTDRSGSQLHRKTSKNSSKNDHQSHLESQHTEHDILQQKARTEMLTFLATKGIDAKLADGYAIHVKRNKHYNNTLQNRTNSHVTVGNNRGRGGGETVGCSVTYTAPDGSILTSKMDVFNAIMNDKRRHGSGSINHTSNHHQRKEAHLKAKSDVADKRFPTVVRVFDCCCNSHWAPCAFIIITIKIIFHIHYL